MAVKNVDIVKHHDRDDRGPLATDVSTVLHLWSQLVQSSAELMYRPFPARKMIQMNTADF